MFEKIISAFALPTEGYRVHRFGTGLINHTWKLEYPVTGKAYIIQKVNQAVFKNPQAIAFNIRSIDAYLHEYYPGYLFLAPLKTASGADYYISDERGFYRLFPFLAHSHSIDVVHTPEQAFEAARQFALFTKLLCGFEAKQLQTTLPHFHDLSLRFEQFTQALESGLPERIAEAEFSISYLLRQEHIVHSFEQIQHNLQFKVRVTHHDTKISNVLFNAHDKGLCVIDLDTVMPGYFISDVGDMMRTYLSPAGEEEKDFSKIIVREAFFRAIVLGYLSEMKAELTAVEQEHFVYAAQYMVYMQALRFLTDYLQGDVYYGAQYAGHNLIRANNQIMLLKGIQEKENTLKNIVQACLKEKAYAGRLPNFE